MRAVALGSTLLVAACQVVTGDYSIGAVSGTQSDASPAGNDGGGESEASDSSALHDSGLASDSGDGCVPTTHNDGFGHTWVDCTAVPPYTEAEALAACAAYASAHGVTSAGYCVTTPCSDAAATAVCATVDNNVAGWAWEGSGAGHVAGGSGSVSCPCPTASDPTWH
jgi:hypothetical protein